MPLTHAGQNMIGHWPLLLRALFGGGSSSPMLCATLMSFEDSISFAESRAEETRRGPATLADCGDGGRPKVAGIVGAVRLAEAVCGLAEVGLSVGCGGCMCWPSPAKPRPRCTKAPDGVT